MRRTYVAIAGLARRFFEVTGIPVPTFVRRVHRASLGASFSRRETDVRDEVAALSQALERLETMAYIDRVGRRSD
jgi:hypothetical protein